MKITLTGKDFNRIMKLCGVSIDSNMLHQSLCMIEIRHDGSGKAYATALDGTVMNQVMFDCKWDKGCFLLHQYRPVSKGCNVDITWDDRSVSVSDGEMAITRSVCKEADVDRVSITRNRLAKKRKYAIAFEPRILMKALKAFDSSERIVFLEFAQDIDAVILRGKDSCSLALPLRVNDKVFEKKLMTFYGQRRETTEKGEDDNGQSISSP